MIILLPLAWARTWDQQQAGASNLGLIRDSAYNTLKFQPSCRWLEIVALITSRGQSLTCS